MEILIRRFDWENLSQMGRFYGLMGRLGEMKRNGTSSRRTERVSRTVLDSELKQLTNNRCFPELSSVEGWIEFSSLRDCSLSSHKKMIGMKVAMLTTFHDRLQDLGCILTRLIF